MLSHLSYGRADSHSFFLRTQNNPPSGLEFASIIPRATLRQGRVALIRVLRVARSPRSGPAMVTQRFPCQNYCSTINLAWLRHRRGAPRSALVQAENTSPP